MKKLLLLIIVLACMGCRKECIGSTNSMGFITEGCPSSEGQSSCPWGKEWDSCTCECEWSF